MERLLQQLAMQTSNVQGVDFPMPDSGEQVYISSLALLKMLKHGRAGVPMEVMGLLVGSFIDQYTVQVIDVFAMPQSGTGVSVEAVDPAYQARMLEMLKLTGRPETVVGWYHSHPGFGCWLSSTDQGTQKSFEALNERCVAVVVDPIQSVKGKVVLDAFRCYNETVLRVHQGDGRETSSTIGHLHKPSVVALVHGLNKSYYSLAINYRKNDLEQKMLLSLNAANWTNALNVPSFTRKCQLNQKNIEELLSFSKFYSKSIREEGTLKPDQIVLKNIGKIDPVKQIEDKVGQMLQTGILQALGASINLANFKR